MAYINGFETMFAARIGTGLSVDEIRDALFPVGVIIHCENSPASFMGGTWERIKDKFLLAANGNTRVSGATGGSEQNTHNHYQTMGVNDSATIFGVKMNAVPRTRARAETQSLLYNPASTKTETVRENSTHNETIDIMPPYLAVNTWKRIA